MFLDDKVMGREALDDGLFLPLHCVVVDIDDLNQLLECHVPYVVVVFLFVRSLLLQKLAQNVDAEDSEAAACFDLHDSLDALGEH